MSFANVGSFDRILRIIIGAGLFAYTFLAGNVAPTSSLGIGAMIVGGILIVTAFISFCPLYAILGLRTRPKQ
jgi:hypothetical protein